MRILRKGDFFGDHYQKLTFEELTLTDTEYTHQKVDWHYHEQVYFTYLLQGKLFEANKRDRYYLQPGSLLLHNWQDTHYNIKPAVYTRGFHIELGTAWFAKYDLDLRHFEGSLHLRDPSIKNLVNRIFFESKIRDEHSEASIESSLLSIFGTLAKGQTPRKHRKPQWLDRLEEILRENPLNLSLAALSRTLAVHPVHLSRVFSQHFGLTLGQYTRHLRLNKAMLLIAEQKQSMTEICYACGFYDQSHFIRTFKAYYGCTPSKILKSLRRC